MTGVQTCALPIFKTKVVWVNEWFSPPKETEAATALINGGADVLFQNTDSPAVLKTAQEKGKRAFGWDSDMTAYGRCARACRRPAEHRVCLCRPGRRRRLDLCARQRPQGAGKGIRRQDQDHLRRKRA